MGLTMDYLMFWGLIIPALVTVVVAIIQGITLYKVGQMQAHAAVQTIATAKVQTDVNRIETNTNSISERLERLAREQGVSIGRAQASTEAAAAAAAAAAAKTILKG